MVRHNILVKPDIIILHRTPMAPFEGDCWWATVHLKYLPSKRGHHALESLVAGCEVGIRRAVVLIGFDDGVVSANIEHVFRGLGTASVHSKGVVLVIDGSPVLQTRFEGCFDLPILDQVLDELRQAASDMVRRLS